MRRSGTRGWCGARGQRWGLLLAFHLVALPPSALAQPGVVGLQRERQTTSIQLTGGGAWSKATLVNLNPRVNDWYLLEMTRHDGGSNRFHLENPFPDKQSLLLDDEAEALLVVGAESQPSPCNLWPLNGASPLLTALEGHRPFADICGETLSLRNPTTGRRTRKEWAADMLRDRLRHGEKITTIVKETFYRDKYRKAGSTRRNPKYEETSAESLRPLPVRVRPMASASLLTTPSLNFNGPRPVEGLEPGRWYFDADYPGIFLAAVTPDLVHDDVVRDQGDRVSPLEEKELSALVYLVAFDLSQFDLGFALGADHPRVGWSERIPESVRTPSLPGPDGFDTIAPLVRTGIVGPHDVPRVAATFAAGFKRQHGAFKWGDLATQNRGSHYGFIEHGVVLSTLQPGLSTILALADGRVMMRTWTHSDDGLIASIRYARQNGVPLVELDPKTGRSRPGAFVRDWGRGNWSGSETKQLRTLRAGLGLQESASGTFLIYGYFSSATPSVMARVFQACACSSAMHLDMNAPEHTYLAIYRTTEERLVVQRLVREMAEVDPPLNGKEVPRFIGYADNRDFFYLLRRDSGD